MPDKKKITCAAAEAEQVTRQRIALQDFLYLEGQRRESFPHVGSAADAGALVRSFDPERMRIVQESAERQDLFVTWRSPANTL